MASPPPIRLSPLDPGQVPLLQPIYDACSDYFRQSSGQPAAAEQAAADLQTAGQDEARHILGIFWEDNIAGIIDLRFGDPGPLDTRLGLILLAPEHRRRGIGSWALRILEAWLARDTPVEQVVAAVPANDHAAQGFFLANGYAFTGQSTRVLAGDTRMRLLEIRKTT